MKYNKNNRSPDIGTPVMVYVSKGMLHVGVDFFPVLDGGHDAKFDDLVAHIAEVFVTLLEFGVLLGGTFDIAVMDAGLVDGCFHCHHDVLETVVVYVGACRPAERFATHGGRNHLD